MFLPPSLLLCLSACLPHSLPSFLLHLEFNALSFLPSFLPPLSLSPSLPLTPTLSLSPSLSLPPSPNSTLLYARVWSQSLRPTDDLGRRRRLSFSPFLATSLHYAASLFSPKIKKLSGKYLKGQEKAGRGFLTHAGGFRPLRTKTSRRTLSTFAALPGQLFDSRPFSHHRSLSS